MYAVFSCLQPSHSYSIMPVWSLCKPRMIGRSVRNRRPKECKFFYVNPVLVRRHFTVSREGASIKSLKVKPRENEIAPWCVTRGSHFWTLTRL